MSICIYTPAEIPAISADEVLRYAGMQKGKDEKFCQLAQEMIEKGKKHMRMRCVYRHFRIEEVLSDRVCLEGGLILYGSLPCTYLAQCDEAVVVLATIGHSFDRMIAMAQVGSSLDGLLADAVGSAAVESLMDDFSETVLKDHIKKPRISPGYGDFALENQENILNHLDGAKTLGVCLNRSLLMSPSKSVTALIGLRKEL